MLKKICIGFGIFVLSIYVLFLILPFVITPIAKGYLPTIKEEITKATGLSTEIENLRIVTTPKLTAGLRVGRFAVLTPEGKQILNANDFQVKMSLLPLFARKIRVDLVKLNRIDIALGLNKDGSFEIEKYFPAQETTTDNKEPVQSEPFVLPLGFKLSNHLPDIRVGGMSLALESDKIFKITAGETNITDFILNKGIKVSTSGNMTLDGVEQFKFKADLNNKIMPDIDLNELVLNPEPAEEKTKKESTPVNIYNILNSIYKNKITASLDTNLKLTKHSRDGYLKLDNVSVLLGGEPLPASTAEMFFKGENIDIDSLIYTAKGETTSVKGSVKTGNKPDIDINIKSLLELTNVMKIVKIAAESFGIKDLETLSANGSVNADFNIKSDLKQINSNGYLKVPSAKVRYGLYDITIDKINADVALENNNINIKNIGFYIFNQPLKFYGTIDKNAQADLHLTGDNLSVRGLIVAAGQAALLKNNNVSGTADLHAAIKGRLDKIKPEAKVTLNNFKFPMAFLSIPKAEAIIGEKDIQIPETPVIVDKIKFNVSGKISDYLSPKMVLDFTTSGDIKSTLKGEINLAKQNLNLVYDVPASSEIIVPMFEKSKMSFNGKINITGNMMNPQLSGGVNVPSLNIPEIPVTIENLTANLNGSILNGKATVSKFTSGGIAAENITSDFSLKGNDFYLKNLTGTAFDGTINGNIIYNISNAGTTVDFSGENMNAQKAVRGAAGIKNALTGTLGFNTKLTLIVTDYNEMMKSLGGNLTFKVENGSFGTIGRIENLFGAANIISNGVLKAAVSSISSLAGVKDTAKFSYISGNLSFKNGWAELNEIKSSGPTLAYYVKGKYNLINGNTNVNILGRLDSSVVALLGPLGDLSADKLLSFIPKLGNLTSSLIKNLTSDPKSENTAAIPALSSGSTSYKDFKVVFNGGITNPASVKSFKWLTKVDTSALEPTEVKVDVKEALNTLKTGMGENVQNVKDAVSSQKDALKQSAQELKNLFKF